MNILFLGILVYLVNVALEVRTISKDEFFNYSNEFKVEDIVPHPTLEGIVTIRYRIAALDKTGHPTGQYRATRFEKIVLEIFPSLTIKYG